MSAKELKRAGVLARVAAGTLRLGSAAALMAVSYRQAKRLYRRYRREGAAGLTHRSAGRASNQATAVTIRERVLALVREKYGGGVDERFGPTLAAEHLGSEDGVTIDHEPCGAGCWRPGCGAGRGNGRSIGRGGRRKSILVSWCRWMAASINGLRNEGRKGA